MLIVISRFKFVVVIFILQFFLTLLLSAVVALSILLCIIAINMHDKYLVIISIIL